MQANIRGGFFFLKKSQVRWNGWSNSAYKYGRYENSWLKSLHIIISNIKGLATDRWMTLTDYIDLYITHMKKSSCAQGYILNSNFHK